MVRLAVAVVVLCLAGMSGDAVPPAELGARLAEILTEYAPVARFHGAAVRYILAGGAPPDARPAVASLRRTAELAADLAPVALALWPEAAAGLRDVVEKAREASHTLEPGLPKLGQSEQEAALHALGAIRSALDACVLNAALRADKMGSGWHFEVAFFAKTVLLKPSPLTLTIPDEAVLELKARQPDELPAAALRGWETLVHLSRVQDELPDAAEEEARQAAASILAALIGEDEEDGGGD